MKPAPTHLRLPASIALGLIVAASYWFGFPLAVKAWLMEMPSGDVVHRVMEAGR
jgi:hypothetical protein